MALFEIDLDNFFDIFSLDNKEILFFSTEQAELKSKKSLETADKSDLAIMVK